MATNPGTTWLARTAVQSTWAALCWAEELGLFVGVGGIGAGGQPNVITSPDGITWTQRTAATDTNWQGVCWSPELGLLVAVGGSGTGPVPTAIMTSPDGITWTSQTPSLTDVVLNAVCWSPELSLFVAVGWRSLSTSEVMTSPDGVTWTTRAASASAHHWQSVCWARAIGLFVAVSLSSDGTINNRVMTSPDGINWTSRTAATNTDWQSVCWSPDLALLVAVSTSGAGNRVMTSPDGINWTTRTSAADNDWRAVIWVPVFGIFIAVASTGTHAETSPDGITWTLRSTAANVNWWNLAWSPSLQRAASLAEGGATHAQTSDGNQDSAVTALTRSTSAGSPGFIDLPDANIAAHQIVTDDSIVKISENAKFAAVRSEMIEMGFYKNGDTVPVPRSPVDGYIYSQSEIVYFWNQYSTRAPGPNFVSGQADAPAIAPGQPANLYWLKGDIDDTTGQIALTASYFAQGAVPETITTDGVVEVFAVCQRASVNVQS